MGERPAILSRGYGRRDAVDGVVVVRDAGGIRADLDRAGDEPLMLARQLDGRGCSGLVGSIPRGTSRRASFRLHRPRAGRRFSAFRAAARRRYRHRDARTTSSTDARCPRDVCASRSTRWRQPTPSLRLAMRWCRVRDSRSGERGGRCRRSGPRSHRLCRHPRRMDRCWRSPGSQSRTGSSPTCGRRAGRSTRELRFRDHHRYSRRDVAAIAEAAHHSGARAVVTTEKDLVRLLPFRPFPVPVAFAPLALRVDRPDTFDRWLMERVDRARRES